MWSIVVDWTGVAVVLTVGFVSLSELAAPELGSQVSMKAVVVCASRFKNWTTFVESLAR